MKKSNKHVKRVLILVGNFILLFALYMIGMHLNPEITFIVYSVLLAAFSFTYVIYNRGFSRRGVTVDMLPDDWPPEKKTEFVESAAYRMERSKWMLTILLPLIAIYGYEIMDLYVIPNIIALF